MVTFPIDMAALLKKLKTTCLVEGDTKANLFMIPGDSTVEQFLLLVREKRTRPDLQTVWINGSPLDPAKPFCDVWSADTLFILSPRELTASPPEPTPQNPPATPRPTELKPQNPPAAHPPPEPKSQTVSTIVALPAPGADRFLVFTSATYDSMTEGTPYKFDMTATLPVLIEKLLPDIKELSSDLPDEVQLHISLPGGIPFTSGTLGDFFAVPDLSQTKRKLYVVVTCPIPDTLLNREYSEVCSAATPEDKLLLSPVCPSTDVGLSHIACLLGFLSHYGANGDSLTTMAAKFSGFAPLILGLHRLTDMIDVRGRHIVEVTASLFSFYRALLPCGAESVFAFVLRTSAFLVSALRGDSRDPPIHRLEIAEGCHNALSVYCEQTNQGRDVLFWRVDIGDVCGHYRMERPKDPLVIDTFFDHAAWFRPVPPLLLRFTVGTQIVPHKDNTMVLLKEPARGKVAAANRVPIMNPLAGSEPVEVEVEALVEAAGPLPPISPADLLWTEEVTQLVQVCFDESRSMARPFCRDVPRILVGAQYLTAFANRTSAFGIRQLQGLLSFSADIRVRCPLSAAAPDFEGEITDVEPQGSCRLWDALGQAAKDLLAVGQITVRTEGGHDPPKEKVRKKYLNAAYRILVIAGGEDVGSTLKPHDLCATLIREAIILDAVIVSAGPAGATLAAICAASGGLAFRPSTVEEGLALFEEGAFVDASGRRKSSRYRRTMNEASLEELARKATFDRRPESQEIALALSRQPLAIPKHILCLNRNSDVPGARWRRILREVRAIAAVQDPASVGTDGDGHSVSLYDPDLKVYVHKSGVSFWQVFIKGSDGTPYENRWWYLSVTFPKPAYPIAPPVFRFISVPFHMNVAADGRVCLGILDKDYTPAMSLVELLQSVRGIFRIPDETTPLDPGKLELYRRDRAEYERRARAAAEAVAKATVDEWIEGAFILADVPDDWEPSLAERV
jgi:ubiquitin-conjugating enzyme E2 D/E